MRNALRHNGSMTNTADTATPPSFRELYAASIWTRAGFLWSIVFGGGYLLRLVDGGPTDLTFWWQAALLGLAALAYGVLRARQDYGRGVIAHDVTRAQHVVLWSVCVTMAAVGWFTADGTTTAHAVAGGIMVAVLGALIALDTVRRRSR